MLCGHHVLLLLQLPAALSQLEMSSHLLQSAHPAPLTLLHYSGCVVAWTALVLKVNKQVSG